MSSARRSDFALVAGVLAGNSGATARFLEIAGPILWSIVRKLEPGPDAESAFLHIIEALKAAGYAKLRAFDGRAQLSTYLALVARDALSERLAKRLAATPRTAWSAFGKRAEATLRQALPIQGRALDSDDPQLAATMIAFA